MNIYDKVIKEKEQKLKLKKELESNVQSLEYKLKVVKEELNNYKQNNIVTTNETSKLDQLNERIKREINFMNKEIPMIKATLSQVKYLINIQDEKGYF